MAAIFWGAATASFSLGTTIEKQFKFYSEQLKRELDLTSSMKDCAFVELNDLHEICTAVNQLEVQLLKLE